MYQSESRLALWEKGIDTNLKSIYYSNFTNTPRVDKKTGKTNGATSVSKFYGGFNIKYGGSHITNSIAQTQYEIIKHV